MVFVCVIWSFDDMGLGEQVILSDKESKGVNMGLGVENSVKSGRESDLSGLRKRYLGNFSI